MKIFRYLAFSALLAMSASGANAQDFDKGAAAYEAGDYQTAWKELLPLAEGGQADAQNYIGWMYVNGEGVNQNDAEAVKWYRLAADQGDAWAQNKLGWMYENGEGVIQDDAEAVKWYRLAADQGNVDAQHNLGWMYDNGKGVVQDAVEAVKWYRLAADQGYMKSQNNLGTMYDNGKGVVQDDAEAVKWYRLAADQGSADAQGNLGWMYENGEGVVQNDAEAVKWYRLAADQGNARAQNNLGTMYDNGKGVVQDDAEAVKWYRLAADQGNAEAQGNLDFILDLMYHEDEEEVVDQNIEQPDVQSYSDESPLKCSYLPDQTGSSGNISCDTLADSIRIVNVKINRGHCVAPTIDPKLKDSLQKYLDSEQSRDPRAYEVSMLLLSYDPFQITVSILEKIYSGELDFMSELGWTEQMNGFRIPVAAVMIGADPVKDYNFGDKVKVLVLNCNLLEYTISVSDASGPIMDWTWKN